MTSGLVLPPGTASVRCGISLDNPLAASFEAWFDQLTLTGGGLIFADGFETGDTSAWTATVP